jgi:hypothetical protein
MVRRMSKRDDEAKKLYGIWREAEARYANLLSELPDASVTKIPKDVVVALTKARTKASDAADKYFKKALK